VTKIFRALSWGGGVQSTTLGEMSANGELERVDVILMADTKFERQKTYEIVDFYSERWRKIGMHVEIISVGDIRRLGAVEHIHIPFRTVSGAPLDRQCTRNFKIRPVKRRIRELMGFHRSAPPHPKPGAVEQWIGFSWEEWSRMKDSPIKFIVNRWPLIEQKMSRWDCEAYLKGRGLPVPIKSACVCCPFRSASEWIRMREQYPDEFRQAIEFDEANRDNPLAKKAGVKSSKLYIYTHAQPLAEANLEADARREKKHRKVPLFVCNGASCWT